MSQNELNQEQIAALPQWAQYQVDDNDTPRVYADMSEAIPLYLEELRELYGDKVREDQYWVDVARRCATNDVVAVAKPGRFSGQAIEDIDKRHWRIVRLRWVNPINDEGEKQNDKWADRNLPAPSMQHMAGYAPAIYRRLLAHRAAKAAKH